MRDYLNQIDCPENFHLKLGKSYPENFHLKCRYKHCMAWNFKLNKTEKRGADQCILIRQLPECGCNVTSFHDFTP